jgi:hypothetical protein
MRKFTTLKSAGKAMLMTFTALTGLVTAVHAQPTATVTVGTGTGKSYNNPINSCYGYTYSQQIYTQAQILAANGNVAPPTNLITKIRFFYHADFPPSSTANSNDWTVYMGNTTTTAFASNTAWIPTTAMTQVFTGIVTFPANQNWFEIVLPTAFVWDGTSSIVIAVDENAPNYNCSMQWRFTALTNQGIYYFDDVTNPVPATPPTGTRTNERPNAQFDFMVPPDNAGATSIFVPGTPFCSGPANVTARIHNYGSNIINNVVVNWSVDGVLQTPITYSTPIDMENTTAGPDADIVLGSVVFDYDIPVDIVAWTSMPNGVTDTKKSNDTAAQSITSTRQGVDFTISPQDTTICIGNSIVLDAGTFTHNPIYVWSTGALTQTISVSAPGPYSVKVMNSDGCQDKDTIYVNVYPNPVANSIAIIDNGGGSFTFNIIGAQNVTNYTWDFGDGTIESGPGPKTHTYDDDGEYTAKVTLTNDCGEVVITRLIAVSNGATDINDIAGLQRELKVFPNPGRDMVTIGHNGGIKMQRVAIYNLMGQQVYSSEVKNGDRHQVSVSGMASGIYNVVIFTDKGKATKKLEVIK